jgi:hypothetical protein
MNRLMTIALAVAATLGAMPAAAQTDRDNAVFDQSVRAFAGSGRGRIYQCKGTTGDYVADDHHPQRLVAIAKAMAVGDERTVAARSGCRLSNDAGPSKAFSGDKLLAMATRTADAVWLVGQVSENYPQSTGYTFEAIVRIPLAQRPATAVTRTSTIPASAAAASAVRPDRLTNAAAAEADADYMRQAGSRRMGGSDEGSGYDVCPSAAAIDVVIDAGFATHEDIRDERIMDVGKAKGCRQGNALLTGIRARRLLTSMGTHWYAASGIEKGRPVEVLIYIN